MASRATLHVLYPGEVLHPTGWNVLIRVPDEGEVTQGGILLEEPEEAEKRGACRGYVEDWGPLAGQDRGESLECWGLKKGMIATFERYEGSYYTKIGSTIRYLMLPEKEILGFIDPEETERNVRDDK
jgi:co-chaperonin GroES (HSP10)